MNNSVRLLTILLPVLILVGCGPSAEEIKEQEKQATLAQWTSAVNSLEELKGYENTKEIFAGVEMYITSDGKGVVFRETQYSYSFFGGAGLRWLHREFGIPDYIIERISNTAPTDGNQKDSYDNVEINWSIEIRDYARFSVKETYIDLRVVD